MKRWARFFGALVLVAIVVVGALTLRVMHYLSTPVGSEDTIVVNTGTTLRPILNELAQRGALREPDWLYAYGRLTGQTAVRAGEYDITPAQTPKSILTMFLEGRVKTEDFTIPEGHNRWQVRDLLAQQRWIEAVEFDRLCDDQTFLKQRGIPGPTCDGYFFPDTYTFARGVPAVEIFVAAFANFSRVLAEVTAAGRGPLNLTDRDFVTLASIIEKETGDPSERPRIACLFYNRLEAKPPWRLQTDPTVIYAATLEDPKFNGNLRRHHLREMDNPYNTYVHDGLPPGPIANPGRAAMQAVAQPMTCSDFFFVSMNNGRHVFCPTLACHEAAVQRWQIDYFRKRRRR